MDKVINEYLQLLMEGNQEQNLLSRHSTAKDILLHIQDSQMLRQFSNVIDLKEKRVIDLGSGQGLPAIPLAIMQRDAEFVLVESEIKKSQFLNDVVEKLALHNVKIVRARIEDIAKEHVYREQFDVVTVRGLAEMQVILEWGMPFLKKGGYMIAWKGPNLDHELQSSENALSIMGGVLFTVEKYLLEDKERALAFIKKEKLTPDKYPRRGGIARKRPL